MVVFESGHYYQVRITPQPLERCWDLEAVDSMLPRGMGLPNGPTTLLSGQFPHPLTAIVSGMAGTWHPPLLPPLTFREKLTSHLPDLQWFCKEMLFARSLELLTVVLAAKT